MKKSLLARLRHRFETSLWTPPALAAVLAWLLVEGLLQLDRGREPSAHAWYLFGGQAEGARDLLATIASSLLTITGVVFSITLLVLQLASGQYSSRVLRTFLSDRVTRFSIAVFVGAFFYALLLLPKVRVETESEPGFVPQLSVFVAFVLCLLSVAVLLRYIHSMAHSIRAIQVIQRVGDETRGSLKRLYPWVGEAGSALPASPPDHEVAYLGRAGVVTSVDQESLLKLACDRDLVLALEPTIGAFVPTGARLFRAWGDAPPAEALQDLVLVEPERTPHQDAAFGMRQLVDVAERALSPGINDPTTAVQALDQLHDLLRSIADRQLPSPVRCDPAGLVRLLLPRPDWDDYVHLALDEIRRYGAGSIQVARRLTTLLRDLLECVPEERRPVLREELALLDAAIDREFPNEVERAWIRRM